MLTKKNRRAAKELKTCRAYHYLVEGVPECLPIWNIGASVVDVGIDEVEEGRKPLLRYAFTTAPCACIDISWLNHCTLCVQDIEIYNP